MIVAVLGLVGAAIKHLLRLPHRMAELAEKAPWSGMGQRNGRASTASTTAAGRREGGIAMTVEANPLMTRLEGPRRPCRSASDIATPRRDLAAGDRRALRDRLGADGAVVRRLRPGHRRRELPARRVAARRHRPHLRRPDGGAALFGFLLRLGLIFLAVMLVARRRWVALVPLGLTLIVTHLGLLFWEMRYVSASLAFPGLKPEHARKGTSTTVVHPTASSARVISGPGSRRTLGARSTSSSRRSRTSSSGRTGSATAAYGFNKIAFICFLAFVVPVVLFLIAGSKTKGWCRRACRTSPSRRSTSSRSRSSCRPSAPSGMRYLPLLISMFFFILIGNIFEVIPTAHMPANARMANPLILALTSWVMFIGVGVKHNGLQLLQGRRCSRPACRRRCYLLVTPIEFLSTFLIRPFSLAVRLFANMLAGHILLVTFSVLTITLWSAPACWSSSCALSFSCSWPSPASSSWSPSCRRTSSRLLTAVYIGGALHPAH